MGGRTSWALGEYSSEIQLRVERVMRLEEALSIIIKSWGKVGTATDTGVQFNVHVPSSAQTDKPLFAASRKFSCWAESPARRRSSSPRK